MIETKEIRLTQFSTSSGCGCKLSPAKLESILGDTQKNSSENLIVGNETRDDAAAFDLGDGKLLISTTDFFTPILDDAFDFGRAAAANSISDVYAMGGTPAFALAILGWPDETLPLELAAKVMEGGKHVCKEAGIPLAGGHSISSKEPFFGLVVNGFVKKENLKRNNTAHEGDILFLTKPIGTGVLSTALKRGLIDAEGLDRLTKTTTQLNKAGSAFSKISGLHAMTDVTGFGLLGHLIEVCEGSHLSAELILSEINFLPGIDAYYKKMCFPDNTYRTWASVEKKVSKNAAMHFIPLCDPQTNGGLLVSVRHSSVNEFLEIALHEGIPVEDLRPIGKMIALQKETVILID